jgi:hypothetical protein
MRILLCTHIVCSDSGERDIEAPLLINLAFDFFSRGGVEGKEISVVKPAVTIVSFMEFCLERTKHQWFHVFCTRVVCLNMAVSIFLL